MNKKGYWYLMKKTQKKFSPKVLIPLSLALTFSTGMPNAYAETEISSIDEITDKINIDGTDYININGNDYTLSGRVSGNLLIADIDTNGNKKTGSLTINSNQNVAYQYGGSISVGNLTLNTNLSKFDNNGITANKNLTINVNDLSISSGGHGIATNFDSSAGSITGKPIDMYVNFTNNSSISSNNKAAIFSANSMTNIKIHSALDNDSTLSLNGNWSALYTYNTSNSTYSMIADNMFLSSKNYATLLLTGEKDTLDIQANNLTISSNSDSSIALTNGATIYINNKNTSQKNKTIDIQKNISNSNASSLNINTTKTNLTITGDIYNTNNSSLNITSSDNTSDVTINGVLSSDNSTVDINAGNSFTINANNEYGTIQTNTDTVNIAANNISLKNTAENASGVALSSSDDAHQRTENQSTLNLTGSNIHIEGTQNAVSLDNAILNINQSSNDPTTYTTTNGKIDFIGATELNNNSVAKISANNQDITFDGAVTVNDSEFTLNSTGGTTEFTAGLTSNNSNINLHFDGENTKLIGTINKSENINTNAPVVLANNSNTIDLTLANGATWENTGASSLDSLTANNSTIIHNTNEDISIDNYSGSATINIAGTNDTGTFEVTSGNFIIGNAQENSSITLSMDNKDIIDTTNVDSAHKALNAMANKLVFINSNDQNDNLKGTVTIPEGLLTPKASAYISFVTDDDQNNDGFVDIDNVIVPPSDEDDTNENPNTPDIDNVEIGNKVTATMRAIRDVATVSLLSWQHEDNTLREQLYALQNNDDSFGVWTRFNRGEFEYANEFKNQYNLVQVGYDKFIKDSHYGIAFSHNDSTTSYSYGSGKNQSNSLSLYRTWHNNNNEYTHTILKVGHLDNDYNIYAAAGHTNGDYTTWATTLSHEYGKKINLSDKYFITPQVQLDYSRVFGADYTTNNGINVEQDDLNSLVGRIGFNLGTSFNNQDNFFLKASICHQFAGTADTILHHGDITNSFTQDLGNTWYELGLGTNIQIGEHTYLMADITKTFGDDLSTPWQYNLGLHWSFN